MARTLREYHDQVESALAGFQKRLANATLKATEGRVSVTSPCGTVRVEVGGDLRLRDLAIRPGALARLTEDELASLITDAYNQALTAMVQAQYRLVSRSLTIERGGSG
ncbi:YbaB/EbfC family nucleoid-associated protein [Phytomonospora sp. NPDC050363]|uniref:YbaB/EbfC family nucleoid-associated protein n=1 Tax=Phytomonospora sp. NPDC050363 TaxID=3155642 RepID=UPI00340E5B01